MSFVNRASSGGKHQAPSSQAEPSNIPGLDEFPPFLRPHVLGLAQVVAHIVSRHAPSMDDAIVSRSNCAAWGFTPRAFADALRRGDIKATKAGRNLVARKEDVEAYLARRVRRPSRPATRPPTNDHAALLAAAGLRRAGT
jgi:hypothetical protein